MKGYLGFGRCTEICATGEGNGNFSALATAGAVGQLLRTLVLLALLTWSAAPARAGRPLAENLVFGSVSKAGRGELGTNLVIEARRGDVGPVVARCRIGEDPGAGDLFFLRIQRESAPALSPVAVDAEDVLTLVVSEAGKASYKTRIKMPAPGRCLRIDFGEAGVEVVVTEVDQAPMPVRKPMIVRTDRGGAHAESARPMELAASTLRVVEQRWMVR
jgi:hypothetical protein